MRCVIMEKLGVVPMSIILMGLNRYKSKYYKINSKTTVKVKKNKWLHFQKIRIFPCR